MHGEEDEMAFLEPYQNVLAWFKNFSGLESVAAYAEKKISPPLDEYKKSVHFADN